MKNALLCFAAFFAVITEAQGQHGLTRYLLDSIQSQYVVDDNMNLTRHKVFECPNMSKRQIYDRAQVWFIHKYGGGRSTIQIQDTVVGVIIGRGFYDNVYNGVILSSILECDSRHIIQMNAEDGRCHVMITLTEWERTWHGNNESFAWPASKVSHEYPINRKGGNKNIMGKAFFALHNRVQTTFASMEKAVQ